MSENKTINGVIVAFRYGVIAGSKRDADLTRQVLDDKNAEDGAGAWSNKLFPPRSCSRRNTYTELRRHLSHLRTYVSDNTFRWEESEWRILPTRRIEAFKQYVEVEGKARANELLEAFITDLPNLIDLARIGRGQAFKESDYPTVAEIREKHKYEVDYRPLPKSEDLNPEIMQEAIQKLNELHVRRLAEANQELVSRFLKPFQTLADQLKDTKPRKIAPILESIQEFVKVIPSLDLSGNEELLGMAAMVGATFDGITAEAIRSDEEIRKRLGDTADSVVQVLGGFKRQFA